MYINDSLGSSNEFENYLDQYDDVVVINEKQYFNVRKGFLV